MTRVIGATIGLLALAVSVPPLAVSADKSRSKLTAKNCPLLVDMGPLGLQNGPGMDYFKLQEPRAAPAPPSVERPFVLEVKEISSKVQLCFGVWRVHRDTAEGKRIGPPHRFVLKRRGTTAISRVFSYPEFGGVQWRVYARFR